MPLKIAFWNVNTGDTSYYTRLVTLSNWCKTTKPDLLILEEVSYTLATSMEKITGMKEVVYAATLDKNDDPTTKQIWALQKDGLDFKGRAVRMPDLDAIRMCVKVSSSTYDMSVWGIHANASTKGGKNAVAAAEEYLATDKKALIGGDLNCPIVYAQLHMDKGKVCKPLSWQNNDLKFSQWRKEYGSMVSVPNSSLHLQTTPCGYYTPKPSPNGVIDYLLYGSGRTVTPLANCASEAEWINVLINFDHCPVVYSVS